MSKIGKARAMRSGKRGTRIVSSGKPPLAEDSARSENKKARSNLVAKPVTKVNRSGFAGGCFT